MLRSDAGSEMPVPMLKMPSFTFGLLLNLIVIAALVAAISERAATTGVLKPARYPRQARV